jgi:hypothetical protein
MNEKRHDEHHHEHHHPPHHHPEHLVEIKIGKEFFKVKPGEYTVAELKKIGGAPLTDELDQVIDKKLVPLPDDGKVCIKGGEVFIFHPRSGGSS